MISIEVFLVVTALGSMFIAITFHFVSPESRPPVARCLLWLVAFLAGSAFLITLGRSVGLIPSGTVPPLLFQLLLYRAWIPLGIAVASLAWCVAPARSAAGTALLQSSDLTRALLVSVALSFVAVEIGKAAHDADMRQFFVASGLPYWMHYAVMLAELAGVAGLFLARLRVLAGLGLILLMLGAIGTHTRNGDPFTDSLEAVQLLLLLAALLGRWRLGPTLR